MKMLYVFLFALIEIGLLIPLVTQNLLPPFLLESQIFSYMFIGYNLLVFFYIIADLM